MKKLLYILTMVTMFSLNANADSYLYLHHNYPNGNKEEVNDSIWVNGEVLNDWYYTDATKSERHFFKNDYEFPTCEGYEFVGFYDETKNIKVFYQESWGVEIHENYIFKTKDFHLYGSWKKIEDTTGINEIENTSSDKEIYTLNGVKVKEITQSGIYIINGKKTYIK